MVYGNDDSSDEPSGAGFYDPWRLKDGDVRSGVVDYYNDRRFLDHYGHTSADRMDRQQEVKEGKCHGYAWHISVCAGDGDGSPAEHGRRHFRR